jgi:glucosamine--fructose-6-phosphate aminotransferase (isomerizing)
MDAKQEIFSLPGMLAETLEKGQPEYELLLRRTRWREGPIYLLSSGISRYASLTGVYAFETLLGWPVVTRGPAAFAAYSMSLLGPGVVVIAISPPGESPAVLEVARAAKARGASLLVLTNKPETTVARMAEGVLRMRIDSQGSAAAVCEQAVMSYLGLIAARIFKKRRAQFDVLEKEFQRLPGAIEWVLHQMSDAVSSLASELTAFRKVHVLGGGFYYPSALQAEHLLRELGSCAQALDPTEFGDRSLDLLDPSSVLVAISSSRCRLKKAIHEVSQRVSKSGRKVLGITDSNDRELTELSTLTVLLPNLTEVTAAVLASVLMHCVTYQMSLHGRRAGQGASPGIR